MQTEAWKPKDASIDGYFFATHYEDYDLLGFLIYTQATGKLLQSEQRRALHSLFFASISRIIKEDNLPQVVYDKLELLQV